MSQAGQDPLLRDEPTFVAATRQIVGVPVAFETNSGRVAEAIRELYAGWPQSDDNLEPQARVTLIEHDTPLPEASEGVMYRMPSRTRLLVLASGSTGVAEIDRGVAYGYVTSALIEKGTDFSIEFVDALTMALATARDRHPVHAATLVRDGTALLLIGRSGAGKSTIAYAARSRGFEVMGEDVAYVQCEPALRVWGKPGAHRLREDVKRHFPELASRQATKLPNGKVKMVVPVERPPVAPVSDPIPVILTPGAVVSLARLGPEDVAAAMSDKPEVGFDLFAGETAKVAKLLGARGGWRLVLSQNPNEAVDALDRLARETRSTSGPGVGPPPSRGPGLTGPPGF